MNIPIAQYFKLPNCDVCVLYQLPASKQNLAQIAHHESWLSNTTWLLSILFIKSLLALI